MISPWHLKSSHHKNKVHRPSIKANQRSHYTPQGTTVYSSPAPGRVGVSWQVFEKPWLQSVNTGVHYAARPGRGARPRTHRSWRTTLDRWVAGSQKCTLTTDVRPGLLSGCQWQHYAHFLVGYGRGHLTCIAL